MVVIMSAHSMNLSWYPQSVSVWVTHIVTHVRYQHRTLSMSAAAAPTRDTMYVHSKGHEVGTPYSAPCGCQAFSPSTPSHALPACLRSWLARRCGAWRADHCTQQ